MPFGKIFKNSLRSPFAVAIASWLITAYIRLVNRTTSWEMIGEAHLSAAEADSKGYILAFWHARLLMVPVVRPLTERPVYMLISTHRDGEIIARGVEPFGIRFVRGTAANPKKSFKEKSGAPALFQMIEALGEGGVIGMTPDGPRGPREQVQPGILRLAAKTGAKILPMAYATSRHRRLNTWDRFYLALPFSKGAFVALAPIEIGADPDAAAIVTAKTALESALAEAQETADARACGIAS